MSCFSYTYVKNSWNFTKRSSLLPPWPYRYPRILRVASLYQYCIKVFRHIFIGIVTWAVGVDPKHITMASDKIHSSPLHWSRMMLTTMRFMMVTIIWMVYQSSREGLLAQILSWIPGMLPYRYSITGLLSIRDLNECIRYAKRVETGMRRRLPLIPKWSCASRRASSPFWLLFIEVMHFSIFCIINSV